MTSAESSEDAKDQDDYYGPSPYPSIIVNRGALPESWYPKWLTRWMLREPSPKRFRKSR